MPRYNHMFDIAFSLERDKEVGSDGTPAMLRAALLKRVDTLDESNDWSEACGLCDTYDVEETS